MLSRISTISVSNSRSFFAARHNRNLEQFDPSNGASKMEMEC